MKCSLREWPTRDFGPAHPYAHCFFPPPFMKARENPFATKHTEKLAYRLPGGVTWPALLERLKAQEYCGSIVGRHGTGKSTLLEEFIPHLKKLGFEPHLIQLKTESSMREKEGLPAVLRRITKPAFILLDGAEQLSTRHWLPVRSAASTAAGFLVTVHRVSRLPTLVECDTNPDLLAGLVKELTGQALPLEQATEMVNRHFGNVRACLRELSDEWSERHKGKLAA